MPEPITEVVITQWLIEGLGGVLNMLERHVRSGAEVDRRKGASLIEHHKQLRNVIMLAAGANNATSETGETVKPDDSVIELPENL